MYDMHEPYYARHNIRFAHDRDRSMSPRPTKRFRTHDCHDPWTPDFMSPVSSPTSQVYLPTPAPTYTDSPVGSPVCVNSGTSLLRDDVTWLELVERSAETYSPPSTSASPIVRRLGLPLLPLSTTTTTATANGTMMTAPVLSFEVTLADIVEHRDEDEAVASTMVQVQRTGQDELRVESSSKEFKNVTFADDIYQRKPMKCFVCHKSGSHCRVHNMSPPH